MELVVVAVIGLVLVVLERVFPARPLPEVAGWWPRALVCNLSQAAVAAAGALLWPRLLPDSILLPLPDGLGVLPAAAAGYLLLTLVYYWWHRARHQLPLLWRWCHQWHHSASRLEVFTSFYKHPLELVANSLLTSLLLTVVLGLGPTATALVVLATGLAELFYHMNLRTPYWLGYLIQRPEMHRVHHQRNRHQSNFADLPLWDLLFGTFHNPRPGTEVNCGFQSGLEQRTLDMLLGRDLHNFAKTKEVQS